MVEQKKEYGFWQKYFGPLVWIVFALIVFLTPRFAGMSMEGLAFPSSLNEWALRLMTVLAFVLVARAGGIDWSILCVFALSSVLSAEWVASSSGAILQVILLGLVCGAVNGILCVFCALPSVIVTLFTGTIIGHLSYLFSQGYTTNIRLQTQSTNILLILCLVFAAAAFALNLVTPLGRPMSKRQEPVAGERASYFLAYVFASIMAAVAGMFSLGVLGTTTPGAQMLNMETLYVLLFVGCSILFDNRVMPLPMAIVGSLLFWAFTSGWSVGNLSLFWQYFVVWGEMVLAFALDRVYLRNYTAPFLQRHKLQIPWLRRKAPEAAIESFAVETKESEAPIVQNIHADTVVINSAPGEATQNILSEAGEIPSEAPAKIEAETEETEAPDEE